MIPKILKIEKSKAFDVLCVFNTGERKIINFDIFFSQCKPNYILEKLRDPKIFNTIQCNGRTVFWPNMIKIMDEKGNITDGEYELDPVVLYEHSSKSEENKELFIA
ncbi:MAG: hypothetical protein IPM42_10240 [Saprospiraceae bacterium]|nr:hypothetical protein [Saprospiraceae bacterium]